MESGAVLVPKIEDGKSRRRDEGGKKMSPLPYIPRPVTCPRGVVEGDCYAYTIQGITSAKGSLHGTDRWPSVSKHI